MIDIVVPKAWSQVATDIIAQKYFRKAGVPKSTEKERTKRAFLYGCRHQRGILTAMKDIPEAERYTSEKDSRQVFNRLAGCWTYWGWKNVILIQKKMRKSFYIEHCYMLAKQMAAPNSPQWFNTGLNWAYGISGPSQGHYYVDGDNRRTQCSQQMLTHIHSRMHVLFSL